MKGQMCAGLVAVFLLEVLGSVRAVNTPTYVAVGRPLSLMPPEASSVPITSITWKIKGDLLAEWVKGKLDLEFYRTFKGRSSLDTTTGRLEVSNMSKTDSGVYSVEINGNIQTNGYDVKVLGNLRTPEVQPEPLVCGSASANTDCVLTCKQPESVTDAEPVTYRWKRDEHLIPGSTGENLNITNDEETQRVKTYSCLMKNPVSEEESRALNNPFFKEPSGLSSEGIAGIVFGFILIVAALVAVLVWKRETVRKRIRECTKQNKSSVGGPVNLDENKPMNPTDKHESENENQPHVSTSDKPAEKEASEQHPANDTSESKTPENPAEAENNPPNQPAESKTEED